MARRKNQPVIDRSEVVAKALEIIDRDGLDGFNIRKLGDELGVNGTSLYYYFEDKDAILHGVRLMVLREERVNIKPRATSSWRDDIRGGVISYRRALLRHPNTAPLMAPPALVRPLGLDRRERVVAKLVADGVPARYAHALIDSAETLAYGSALLNPRRLTPRQLADVRPEDEAPTVEASIKAGPRSADALFLLQLDALLDGWSALVDGRAELLERT